MPRSSPTARLNDAASWLRQAMPIRPHAASDGSTWPAPAARSAWPVFRHASGLAPGGGRIGRKLASRASASWRWAAPSWPAEAISMRSPGLPDTSTVFLSRK